MHTRRKQPEGKDMSHFFFESVVDVEVSGLIVQLGRFIQVKPQAEPHSLNHFVVIMNNGS